LSGKELANSLPDKQLQSEFPDNLKLSGNNSPEKTRLFKKRLNTPVHTAKQPERRRGGGAAAARRRCGACGFAGGKWRIH
jgi:hypothetical protein